MPPWPVREEALGLSLLARSTLSAGTIQARFFSNFLIRCLRKNSHPQPMIVVLHHRPAPQLQCCPGCLPSRGTSDGCFIRTHLALPTKPLNIELGGWGYCAMRSCARDMAVYFANTGTLLIGRYHDIRYADPETCPPCGRRCPMGACEYCAMRSCARDMAVYFANTGTR